MKNHIIFSHKHNLNHIFLFIIIQAFIQKTLQQIVQQQSFQQPINFNIPCTQDLYKTLESNKLNLTEINTNFTLNAQNCSFLQSHPTNQINLNIIQSSQNACQLSSIHIDLLPCQNNYSLTITPYNSNKQPQITLKTFSLNLKPHQNLTIKNLIFHNYSGPSLTLLNLNTITLHHTTFKNRHHPQQPIFHLKTAQNLLLNNTSFKNITITANGTKNDGLQAGFIVSNIKTIQFLNSQFHSMFAFQRATLMDHINSDLIIIKNCTFTKIRSLYFAGIFHFHKVRVCLIENCTFTDNSAFLHGGIVYYRQVNTSIINNTIFENNKSGTEGGIFYMTEGHYLHKVENTKFINNSAKFAGISYLITCHQAIYTNTLFLNNTANLHGGTIIQKQNTHITVKNCTFLYNKALKGRGGALALEEHQKSPEKNIFIIQNNTFSHNIAEKGGAISLYKVQNFTQISIQNCSFFNNSALNGYGGALFIAQISEKITVKNLQFQSNFAEIAGGALYIKQLNSPTTLQNLSFKRDKSYNKAGALEIAESSHISLQNTLIESTFSLSSSAGLRIFKCNNLTITNITGLKSISKGGQGSIALYSSSFIVLNDLYLGKNHALGSSSLTINSCNNIKVTNLTIHENTASNQCAGLYIYQSSLISIRNAKIDQNYADFSSAGMIIQLSNDTRIENSTIKDNFAKGSRGGISILQANSVKFLNSTIKNNTSSTQSGGIYAQLVQNLLFSRLNLEQNKNYDKLGGAMTLIHCEEIQIEDSSIIDNFSKDSGAAIYSYHSNHLILNKVDLRNNKAYHKGGAIFLIKSVSVQILASNFIQNEALQESGAIFAQKQSNLLINYTEFTENQAGALKITENCEKITILNSSFLKNKAKTSGAAISFQNSLDFVIKNVIFELNSSFENGVCLFIENSQQVIIKKSSFKYHNQNYKKGVIYINNLNQLQIHTSTFIKNTAQQQAGAIYAQNLHSLLLNSTFFDQNQVIIDQNQQKQENQEKKGGTIYLKTIKNIQIIDCYIKNSQAFLHGGALYLKEFQSLSIANSNFSKNSVFLSQNHSKNETYTLSQGGALYLEPSLSKNCLFSLQNSTFHYNTASSGGAILINKKPNSDLQISIIQTTFRKNTADLGPSIRFLTSQAQKNNKITLISVKNEQNQALFTEKDYFFGYFYNEKQPQKHDSQFTLCPQGYYLQKGGSQDCKKCLPNAICEGGYIPIYPKPTYWRPSPSSYNIYPCHTNPSACLGNDTCKSGHLGPLCENCDQFNRYSLDSSTKECKKCDENRFNIIFSISLFFLLIVLFLFNQIYGVTMKIKKQLIYSTLNTLFNIPVMRINQLSASTKILVLHFQVLYVTVGSHFDKFKRYLNAFQVMGSPSQGFSRNLECLVIQDSEDNLQKFGYRLTLYGAILLLGTLIFLLFIEIFCFFLQKYIRKQAQLFQYIQGTMIIFFMFIQPSMVLNSLQYLKSRNIDGIEYCLANTFIKIDSSFYKKEVFPLNVTILIIFTLVFPLFLAILLLTAHKKRTLKHISVQRKIGALYQEYKDHHFYWELLLIILKTTIVLISLYLDTDTQVKGYFVVLLFVGYIMLCLRFWPYKTQKLNQLAIQSSFIQLLTIGILTNFENSQISDHFQHICQSIILLLNLYFILFSSYLMINDFKYILRCKMLQYCNFSPRLQQYLLKITSSEYQAIKKWKTIKIVFWYSVYRSREYQEDKELFYDIGSFQKIFKHNYRNFQRKNNPNYQYIEAKYPKKEELKQEKYEIQEYKPQENKQQLKKFQLSSKYQEQFSSLFFRNSQELTKKTTNSFISSPYTNTNTNTYTQEIHQTESTYRPQDFQESKRTTREIKYIKHFFQKH